MALAVFYLTALGWI